MRDEHAQIGAPHWLVALALAIAAGATVPVFVGLVEYLGEYIPRPDVQADYLIGVVWALVLWASILVWPVPRAHRKALMVLWGAKVFVTLGFMLLYEHFYPVLDFQTYLEMGSAPELDWAGVGLGQGTQNMIALSWVHAHFLTPSYHAMKVSFAFIGLLGVYFFYRGIVLALGRDELRMLLILGLFPSILFWSSILGKDPVVLLGIGVYAYGVMGWSRRMRWPYLLAVAVGIWLATMIRVWAAPILLAPLILAIPGQIRGVGRKTAFVLVSSLVLAASVARFAESFGMETMQDLYSTTNAQSRAWAGGGSGQTINAQFTGPVSMLKFMPIGAFTALFRPLPGEVMNPFGLLAGLESALLLGLVVLALKRVRWATLRQPLVVWAVSLVVVWASIYGFVSSQNLGSAVRFKLQILPMLLILLLYLSRKQPPALASGRTA
ncbi:MAG TPA: hypothetical protein VF613_24160 [Longimicrobium sp.]